ncbi:MAG: hypothetical protein K2X87_14855, partial [Gemmataceae bacterium]|nr:hypothetical protein [Gemmataceae bacterium]
MRCRAAVIAAWVGLAAAPAAAAVRHPDHPDTPIEQVVKGPATDAAGNPRRARVTARGAEPVELPPDPRKPNQPVVKVPRLRPVEFAETFFVGADTQDHYLLLKLGAGNAITEYAGWVQRDRVLTRSEAVFDQDSLIYRKAMIINTRDMIGAAAKDGGLPIRHAPDATTPSVDEPLRLFGVYFVYGEAADAGGQAHVLLGGLPAFDPDPDPKAERHVRKVVFGWVPRDRVCPWNTREAVEWDWRPTLKDDALRAVLDPAKRVNMRPFSAAPPPPRRAAPGRIYSTPDDARRALRGEEPAQPVLMEEQLDAAGEAREPGFADMRFPVLDWDAKAHGPQDGFTHPAAGRLYRVGVLGGFRSIGGGKGPDPRQIQKLLAELARLEKELTVTEVLFVVDDTQSIAPWFIDIANTFKQLKAAAAAGKAKNVRIGLVFYNDVTPTNAVPVKPWRPKGKAGDDRVLWPLDQYGDEMIRELDVTDETRNLPRDKQVSNHKYTDGVDRREMVFRGIREAVALAKFSPVARKLVVVIGDDGDRDPGDPKFKEYQATYNPAKLVEDLVPPADAGHSAVEFYAVQVVNPADRDQLAFRDQMTEVVNLYKAEAQAAGYPPRAQLVTATQADALAARVRKAFEETEGDVETSRVALERLRRGQWKSTVFTPEMEKIIRKRLEALNDPDLTFDRLRQLDGFQLFEIGYV